MIKLIDILRRLLTEAPVAAPPKKKKPKVAPSASEELPIGQQAAAKGLEDYKFGRYGTDGTVTHINVDGKLTPKDSVAKPDDAPSAITQPKAASPKTPAASPAPKRQRTNYQKRSFERGAGPESTYDDSNDAHYPDQAVKTGKRFNVDMFSGTERFSDNAINAFKDKAPVGSTVMLPIYSTGDDAQDESAYMQRMVQWGSKGWKLEKMESDAALGRTGGMRLFMQRAKDDTDMSGLKDKIGFGDGMIG